MGSTSSTNIKIQWMVVSVAVVLFIIKVIAYWLTHSVAILTDALESTVNVVAGLIGLYSLYVAARPRDADHPYGHGKVEFISAAIEGTLISMAGLVIVYESIQQLLQPKLIQQVDTGIYLIASTAIINYGVGWYCEKAGEKNKSLALIASGKHLKTDTYSTIGIILGLVILYLTHWTWIDSAVAIFFGLFILYAGYSIIRKSIAGIMDEADMELLGNFVNVLNESRAVNWIDIHNLRVIKYGATLHIDCHLTVPWYLNVHEAHGEVDALGKIIRASFGDAIELFVHTDGCLPFSCAICQKEDCRSRRSPFQERINWSMENLLSNQKHRLPS